MSEWYTVQQGDCLSQIGESRGIPWKKIWDHAENEPLRDSRGDPNVLYPGDRVYIPDLEEKQDPKSDGAKHKYKRPGRLELRIAVLDVEHKPISGVKYHFVIGGEPQPEGSTDSDGFAKVRLPRHCSSATLKLPWGSFPVLVGELDPARTIRGIQQRLLNLGINPGPVDNIYGPKTAHGIREFQAVEHLPITGHPDPDFILRLREVHDRRTLSGKHNELEQTPIERPEIGEREEVDASRADVFIDTPPAVHDEQASDLNPLFDPRTGED